MPVSTNTQVSWSPTALCTSAAATAESTPPDRPQITRSPPTCARISSTRLLDDRGVASTWAGSRHTSNRKRAARPGRARCARPRGGTARRRPPRSRSSSAAIGAPGVDAVTVKPVGRGGDRVAVAHPHDLLGAKSVEHQPTPRRCGSSPCGRTRRRRCAPPRRRAAARRAARRSRCRGSGRRRRRSRGRSTARRRRAPTRDHPRR